MKYKFLPYLSVLFLLACFSSNQLNQPDYTYLYDPEQRLIRPDLKIFHDQEESSLLHVRIKKSDLLYGKLASDTNLTSRVLMRYRLYDQEDQDKLIDSATIALIDYGNIEGVDYLESKSRIKIPMGDLYRLRIYFRDEYKDLNTVYDYQFDKRMNGNPEFYLFKEKGNVLYQPYAHQNQKITIIKSPLIKTDLFHLDSSHYSFKMTPPPFIEEVDAEQIDFTYREDIRIEDSVEIFGLGSLNRIIPDDSSLIRPHFYFFREGFPFVTKVSHMIDPLRYISTTSEYRNLKNALNQKKEVDQFWLKMAGDENTAKRLIREYYSRVELANYFFTTYQEGWKTDRGIIFIVYGQPTTIYKDLNKESWIYGEENNILSVKFTFKKIRTEESDNIFIMERSSDFKSNWYRAVDSWRQGRIES